MASSNLVNHVNFIDANRCNFSPWQKNFSPATIISLFLAIFFVTRSAAAQTEAATAPIRIVAFALSDGTPLARAAAIAQKMLKTDVIIEKEPIETIPGAFDDDSGRYDAQKMLDALEKKMPGQRAVLVTSVPLFHENLMDMYGWSDEKTRKALVSTKSLDLTSNEHSARRLATELLHEIGHTFGLKHCIGTNECPMNYSTRLGQVDAKGARYCNYCKMRITQAQDEEKKKAQKELNQTDPDFPAEDEEAGGER